MENRQFKIVYNVVDRGEKSFWNRIGIAFTNRDGSMSVKLDALPLSGSMQVRDWTPKDDAVSDSSSRKQVPARSASAQPVDDFPTGF